jgi:iron complex transport system permease protein
MTGRRRDRAPLPAVLAACWMLLLITMTAGVGIGSVALSPAALWQVIAGHLSGHPENSVAGIIVWQIRLPRVLLGLPRWPPSVAPNRKICLPL